MTFDTMVYPVVKAEYQRDKKGRSKQLLHYVISSSYSHRLVMLIITISLNL